MIKDNPFMKMKSVKKFLHGRIPGQLIIQLTDKCNAKCPQCGMRVTEDFQRSKLKLDDVKRMIDAAVEKGVESVSFTGGETFLYFNELIELMHHAGQSGIEYIRTGTNGFSFMNSHKTDYEQRINKMAEALAKTNIRNFWISIDSSEGGLHEEMRGLPGVIRGIEKAIPIFHEHGIYPSVNLGINRNVGGAFNQEQNEDEFDSELFYNTYQEAFRKFYSFVIDLGFTIANACYPMSVNHEEEEGLSAVYGATSADEVVKFSSKERVLLFKALMDTIPEYRSKIRIFSPQASLHALIKQYSDDDNYSQPCRGGIDFFYVDAKTGDTFPCGYRGEENLGKFWDLDLNKMDGKAFCKQCDWECFRDPSELLGQMLDFRGKPISTLGRFTKDKEYQYLWMRDLKYYKACDYFNGRTAPSYNKLACW
ncbi:MAG: radical SAM protein [Clostridia bacterium]|nr:radical SAM protein [Clostridia bacterium]